MSLDAFKLFETALGVDRKTAQFIFFGFLILALSGILTTQFADIDVPIVALPIVLLALSILIASLSRMSGRLKTLVAWVVVLLFLSWLTAFVVQSMFNSILTPPMATAECMVKPFDEECQKLKESAAAAVDVAPAEPVRVTASLVARPAPPPAASKVFVQFSALPREEVVSLAQGLAAAGWGVEDVDRGGERLAAADGLMEVRYFHVSDAPAATALAKAVTLARKANPPVGVRDFSQTRLAASVPEGQFEVWISR